MSIKAVLFDLDGLLVDSEGMGLQIYQDLLEPHGASIEADDYAANYIGHTAYDGMVQLIAQFDLPFSVDEGLALHHQREAFYLAQGIDLLPGARELLVWLRERGVTTCLATSSTPDRAQLLLEHNAAWEYFDHRAYGHEVEHSKPAPDIFLLAAKRAGVTPNECLVLEDSDAGVRAAHAAGIQVICVPNMRRPDEEVASLTLALADSLHEVPTLIEGLI